MRALAFALFLFSVLAPAAARATPDPKSLVVMIYTRAAPDEEVSEYGAGVMIANDGKIATIITAAHVINLANIAAPVSSLSYLDNPEREHRITTKFVDAGMDLAVVTAPTDAAAFKAFQTARRVLPPGQIETRASDTVFAIGNPDREPWSGNERPEPIVALSDPNDLDHILFDSSVTTQGMSGGGLFSKHGVLLGIVLRASVVDRALSLAAIRRRLDAEGISFELQENPDAIRSIAADILNQTSSDKVGDLRAALLNDQVDFNRLHLFWLSGQPQEVFERSLRDRPGGANTSTGLQFIVSSAHMQTCAKAPGDPGAKADFASRVVTFGVSHFAGAGFNGSCSQNLQLWVRQAVKAGLDPDLVLTTEPSATTNGRWSLLAAALRHRNTDVALALLEAGAAPNPYEDLEGYGPQTPLFTHPLSYVLDHYEGLDLDRTWDALVKAGVVVATPVANAGRRTYRVASSTGMRSGSDLCRRVSARDGIDWCDWQAALPTRVAVKLNAEATPGEVRPVALLSVINGTAYLIGFLKRDGGEEPVLLEISRTLQNAKIYWHASNYGCQPNPRPGGAVFRTCWRSYEAAVGGETLAKADRPPDATPPGPVPPAAIAAPADLRASIIGTAKFEGLALATSLNEARRTLLASGYRQTTVGDPEAPELKDANLTIRFQRNLTTEQVGFFEITLTARGGHLLAIAADYKNAPDAAATWIVDPERRSPGISYRLLDKVASRSNARAMERLILVEALPDGSAVVLQRHAASPNGLFSNLFLARRSKTETDVERAFLDGKLNEQIPPPTMLSNGICVDDYKYLRARADTRCQTAGERAIAFLKENGGRSLVETLPNGVQYEYLSEGVGPRLKRDARVRVEMISWKVDYGRNSPRVDRAVAVVGAKNGRNDDQLATDLLPTLKVGDKIKFYFPPDLYNDIFYAGEKLILTTEMTVLGYEN